MCYNTDGKNMAQEFIQIENPKLLGKMHIKKDVFYSIALLAVQEEKRALLEKKSLRYAVDVNIKDNQLSIVMDVKIHYGKNVNEVCKSIQDKVNYQIEQMTGLIAKKVDVNVVGFMISAH
jgi:uncharacterized alkaline shock family protein YloU